VPTREYIVIDELLKKESLLRWIPPLAGLAFIFAFVSLGLWQLDRAAEKTALLELFQSGGGYTEVDDYDALEEFDRIEVSGRYRPDRQILIDNIPLEGRLGYYVITPFEPSTNEPLLLVNRGWVLKDANPAPNFDIDTGFVSVQGLVGHLPRVAIRPGEAFAVHEDWPRVALYPTSDEVARELGEAVLPVVLLLSPDAADGFVRHWQPNVSGPMTHYSYAFQWFAMAVATIALMGWHLRRRSRHDATAG
jgi:surfeit locus 1 family protein